MSVASRASIIIPRGVTVIISIPAPRAGSDLLCVGGSGQSSISIHAPRAGSDSINAHFSSVYL